MMREENEKIEQRMRNMKKFYTKVGDIIDDLPDAFPKQTKEMLKNTILGDKELKQLMEGVDCHRPPRIFLVGRTGSGKSSLINALCGAYIANVSNTRSCTENTQVYQCKDRDRVLMEILDTRGIAESESLNSEMSAEEMLIDEVNKFSPDVAILMLNCTHRDDVNSDVEFLKKITQSYAKKNSIRLPVVVVVNKCDDAAPARIKNPKEYSESKIKNINETVLYYKEIIVKNGLKIDDIIAVSSLIDWKTADGIEIDAANINNLPTKDIENLQIDFDGRYQIDKLLDILEESILDFDAQMGLRMAARLTDVVRRVACHLNKIFSGLSATIALTPIPVSDLYILLSLQAVLVCLIGVLSGRDVSLKTAKEFIFSLGGIAGTGLIFRTLAQQSTKLLNLIFPGAGSTVSATVAALGTNAIGKAAIAYYIEGKSIKEAKKKFNENKKEREEASKYNSL